MPKYSSHLDLQRAELRNAVTQNLASAPSDPVPGLRYYDTTLHIERYYSGSDWIDVPAAPSLGALAFLDKVGAAEITNGSITDTDISPTASIALSKLAPGGTTGQVLAKQSTADYDTTWIDPAGGDFVLKNGTYTNVTTDAVLRSRLTGDTQPRLTAWGDGTLDWGSGAASYDARLARDAVASLTLTGRLSLTRTETASPPADTWGLKSAVTFSGSPSVDISGVAGTASKTGAGSPGGSIIGVKGEALATAQTSGTISQLIGVAAARSFTGTVTQSMGMRVRAPGGTGGSATQSYGVYIENQSAMGLTSYGIYVAANTGSTSYGAAIGSAGWACLWLSNDTNLTDLKGGIVFGNSRDCTLYRGGNNILKTDGQMIAAGAMTATAFAATGISGANQASRHAGATASGAPTSGTFLAGDFIIDRTGKIWICTVAGSPGTWVSAIA